MMGRGASGVLEQGCAARKMGCETAREGPVP